MTREPLELSFPGISLSLTPEAVRLNELAMVHAAFTRVVVSAFLARDPENFPGWCMEVGIILRRALDSGETL